MSSTYIAGFVSLLTLGLPAIGIEIADEETLRGVITDLVGIASLIYIFIGRYRAGGINAFGIRKY